MCVYMDHFLFGIVSLSLFDVPGHWGSVKNKRSSAEVISNSYFSKFSINVLK